MINKRILICDPLCAHDFAHNARCNEYFAKAIKDQISESVECIVAKNFSSEYYDFSNILKYNYSYALEPDNKSLSEYKRIDRLIEKIHLKIKKKSKKIWAAKEDWKFIFSSHSITQNDIIFLPSADYYSVMSLLSYCVELPSSKRPAIKLRFIGVWETLALGVKNPLIQLLDYIKSIKNEINLNISAETPIYRDMLQRYLNFQVHYLPYPPVRNNSIEPAVADLRSDIVNDRYNVTIPGTGRPDKGFFSLLEIARHLYVANENNIVLVCQDMRKEDKHYSAKYSRQLRNAPNVRLKPAVISDSEIDQIMNESDLFLLNYDARSYKLRGSAIFQEAVAMEKPILTSRGPAFSYQIDSYKAGAVCSNQSDILNKIDYYYKNKLNGKKFENLSAKYKAEFDKNLYEIFF